MITVTDNAAEKIKDLFIEQNDPTLKGLRIFVQGGGCNGFQYGFTFDSEINEDDFIIDTNEIKIMIDSISSGYIMGAKLDYKEEPFSSQFVIDNPNATSKCGCGSSFGA